MAVNPNSDTSSEALDAGAEAGISIQFCDLAMAAAGS
jgi:hypothetical protein